MAQTLNSGYVKVTQKPFLFFPGPFSRRQPFKLLAGPAAPISKREGVFSALEWKDGAFNVRIEVKTAAIGHRKTLLALLALLAYREPPRSPRLSPCASPDETQSPLLPVNSSQQEYCITNDGDVLLAGDSWKANACTSCTCNNGAVQCFSQSCPAASCRVPVLRKGQCCPHCLGERSEPGAVA